MTKLILCSHSSRHINKIKFLYFSQHANKFFRYILKNKKLLKVRFCYEAFRKLRIGTSLFELHGRQKEPKRMAIYFTFSEKKAAVLFTTNLAARGLDFPGLRWVV